METDENSNTKFQVHKLITNAVCNCFKAKINAETFRKMNGVRIVKAKKVILTRDHVL